MQFWCARRIVWCLWSASLPSFWATWRNTWWNSQPNSTSSMTARCAVVSILARLEMLDMTPTWCHPTRIFNTESLLLFHLKARPYLQPHADSDNAHPGAVIDNLTATIVCVKILKRVVPHKKAPLYITFWWANWFQFGTSLQIGWSVNPHRFSGLASFLWWPHSCGCQCWRCLESHWWCHHYHVVDSS